MQSHQAQNLEKLESPSCRVPDRGSWVAVLLMLGLLVSMCAVVYWGRNRGLCINDESFCILLCKQPADFDASLSCWHLFASKLPRISSHIVSNFRLWHLIVQVISATIFAIAFSDFAKRYLPTGGTRFLLLSIALAGMANLLPFSFYPLALSYNSLVSFFVYCAVSCVLLALSASESVQTKRKEVALIALAGVLLGFCFFVKATSALAVFLLICMFVFSVKRVKMSLVLCTGQLFGALTGVALFFLCFVSAPVWMSNVTASLTGVKSSAPGLSSVIFSSVFSSFPAILFACIRSLSLVILACGTAWIVREKPRIWLTCIPIVTWFVLCVQILLLKEFLPGGKSVGPFFVTALALFGFLLLQKFIFRADSDRKSDRTGFAVVALLGLLPFCCSVGTGNNLFEHTANHLVPVFLLVLLLSGLIWRQQRSLLLPVLMVSTVCITASWQFFRGVLYTPYGLALPMRSQNLPTSLPGIEGQRLCLGGKVFLERVNALLVAAGFQKGDTILGFYNLPGVLLASCGTAPGSPAFFPEPSTNSGVIKSLRKLEPHKRLFLLQTWTLPQEVLEELKLKGYNFPEKFELLGSVDNPYGDPSMYRKYSDKSFLNCRVNVYAFHPGKGE